MITLVLGGSRSGKSAVAERLAAALPAPLTYVATAVIDPADADFTARVEAHRRRRPSSWSLVEAGSRLVPEVRDLPGSILIDALGTWVAATDDFAIDVGGLCDALSARTGDAVVVSDEVGLGVHPASELGRQFRDVLGEVNQAVAAVADRVLLVIAGRALPLERI
jgi:adenosyl cobinamide kinase/adenosyl cobinamide phosphate guanylyltransferase